MDQLASKAFKIDLVRDYITDKLDVIDMKKLAQVNHEFLSKIRGSSRFQTISLFPMSIKNFFPEQHPKHPIEFIWKNVEIDITDSPNSYDLDVVTPILRRRLEEVEWLYIYEKYSYFDPYPGVEDSVRKIQTIRRILSSTPKLKSLTILIRFLKLIPNLFEFQEVVDRVKQLKYLHFTSPNYFPSHERDSLLLENLRSLANIPMKLRSFSWKECLKKGLEDLSSPVVLEIIRGSQSSLESLSLDGDILKTEGLQDLRCPLLGALKVRNVDFSRGGYPHLHKFLNSLENLRDLDITLGYIDAQLVHILEIKSRQWKLKRFRLGLAVLDQVFPVNFNLLSVIKMGTLRHFEFWSCNMTLTHLCGYRKVLPELPSDLISLNLRGLVDYRDGPNRIGTDSTASLSAFVRSELERFSYLTELSLLNNPGYQDFYATPVDEDLLRFIYTNMTQLKLLRLSNYVDVKELNVRAQSDDSDDEISILNLKNLRELSIINCPGILEYFQLFPDTIKFPEITFLMLIPDRYYSEEAELSLTTWEKIVMQNSQLQTIVLSNRKHVNSIAGVLKKLKPSLRRVFNAQRDHMHNVRFLGRPCRTGTLSARYYEDSYSSCSVYEGDEETLGWWQHGQLLINMIYEFIRGLF